MSELDRLRAENASLKAKMAALEEAIAIISGPACRPEFVTAMAVLVTKADQIEKERNG